MIPRPGSVTERIIEHIRKVGTARASAIAEALGIGKNQVPGRLAPYVTAGELIACKVEVPGSPPQNEYRIGSGIRPLTMVDELHKFSKSRPPRPDPFPPSPAEPLPTTPVAAAVAHVCKPDELAMKIGDDGTTELSIDGKPFELTPALAAQLGNFFLNTQGLWRNT